MKKNELINQIDTAIEEYKLDANIKNYRYEDKTNIISLDLKDEDIYAPYSGKSLLCNDIFDFISEIYSFCDLKSPIEIEIHFDKNLSDDDKNLIISKFKSHYAIRLKQLKKEINNTNLEAYLCLGAGIICFIIYFILLGFYQDNVFIQIISTVACFLTWGFCDFKIFTQSDIRKKQLKCLRLFNAKIKKM